MDCGLLVLPAGRVAYTGFKVCGTLRCPRVCVRSQTIATDYSASIAGRNMQTITPNGTRMASFKDPDFEDISIS
jgi:hypothetical protein